jgi:hypothetical protein
MFKDDIYGVADEITKDTFDGFCIPKVNNKEMVQVSIYSVFKTMRMIETLIRR